LPVRDSSLVRGIEALCCTKPFPLRGIGTDNGREFVSDDIEFTRSRPYKKNDQAWLEQKNGPVVRRIVGLRST
jgi:hypothetical protein